MPVHQAPDFRADPSDRRDLQPRRRRSGLVLAVAALVFLAVLGWFWWSQQGGDSTPTVPPPVATAPVPAATPAAPAVLYPIEAEEGTQPLTGTDVGNAVAELLGQDAYARFIQAGDFPRRFVATVDNLGRDHAAPALWPVVPTAGRFTVAESGNGPVIAADNAARYRPFVLFVQAVDAERAAALYRRMYPLLQQAYVQLGFGDRYFNDRVIEVIDLLLATPEPAGPLAVKLTEVKGPIASERPWVRYLFVDSRFEALPAGQKIMLRVGAVQRGELKAKLRELRQQLVVR